MEALDTFVSVAGVLRGLMLRMVELNNSALCKNTIVFPFSSNLALTATFCLKLCGHFDTFFLCSAFLCSRRMSRQALKFVQLDL